MNSEAKKGCEMIVLSAQMIFHKLLCLNKEYFKPPKYLKFDFIDNLSMLPLLTLFYEMLSSLCYCIYMTMEYVETMNVIVK